MNIIKNNIKNEKTKKIALKKQVPGVENIFKNIKGYYLSRGNYEAFAKPRKFSNVENKKIYLVGGGIASLAAAVFLLRDVHVPGKNIIILESDKIAGGAMDGRKYENLGFIVRGGRELEDHYECMWDLLKSIPSLEDKNFSVLDEFFWLNKDDPCVSLRRTTKKCGNDGETNGQFTLSSKAMKELIKLMMSNEDKLNDLRINQVFGKEFFASNFWLYWRTMFAFQEWHSAIEMRRYLLRFIHHIDGIADLTALKFTRYNQYESIILPITTYLKNKGVKVQYDSLVTNVKFKKDGKFKTATHIELLSSNKRKVITLQPKNDFVFITNGSCVENSTFGNNDNPAIMKTTIGPIWQLWKNIAKQSPDFGNPDKFISDFDQTHWISATAMTSNTKIIKFIANSVQRGVFTGSYVTGGPLTIKDSNWLLGYSISRYPHFKKQPKNHVIVWIYGLLTDKPGNYIKKPMKECSGHEITKEWLYHLGIDKSEINELTKSVNCIPCMMPYITSFFMPRSKTDRPKVIVDGATNFAFLGQWTEVPDDCVFTVEYSVRTAMIAVYALFNVERGVPETFGSRYDIRYLLRSIYYLHDKQKIVDWQMPFFKKAIVKKVVKKLDGTWMGDLLKELDLI